MNQLAAGVVRIPTRGDGDNCFLITDDDGLTLVDVGWKNAPAAIGQAIAAQGFSLSDLRRIVITHAHPDHVRGLPGLVAGLDVDILIHELDAAWLMAGRVPSSGRSGSVGRLVDRLPLLHWEPVEPTRTLVDGDRLGPLRVIHTPGHSPGHIVLLHEPTRTLLVGDAVFNRDGLSTGRDALAADPATRNSSYAKLPRDVAAVGFAHGAPLLGAGAADFADWLEGIGTLPGRLS